MYGYVWRRYIAKRGRVYLHDGDGYREVSSALTARGRDLQRFDRAVHIAKAQREAAQQ